MSDNKPWYNDGCLVIAVLVVAVALGPSVWKMLVEVNSPGVGTTMRAGVTYPLLSSPNFTVKLWHQHTGDLHNGVLRVQVTSPGLKGNGFEQTEVYSFERWSPNEDNAQEFSFPLKRVDANDRFEIRAELDSAGTRKTITRFTWKDGKWLDDDP